MRNLHLYIHVPFCVDPCGYCDFYRKPHAAVQEQIYVEGILAEINRRIPAAGSIASLYFGGGTPSLLTPDSWSAIFRALTARSVFASDAEISIESNPASVTAESARFWKSLGINRVSVGVQSLNDRILRYLNRLHSSETALAALEILRDSGFDSVNADLIYGIPDQTVPDCVLAVRRLAPALTHLSAYSLTVEPHTPFGRRGVRLPPEDIVADQYESIVQAAVEAGLDRYEVSNFARPGKSCRHNLNTWRYGAYVGLGPSAVGFDGTRRYKNVPDLGAYAAILREGNLPESESEFIDDPRAVLSDRLMLGLRTTEGLECAEVEFESVRSAAAAAGILDCFDWHGRRTAVKPDRLILLDEILTKLRPHLDRSLPRKVAVEQV